MQPEHVLAIIALSVAGVAVTWIALRHRTRVQYQMTVRAALDKGQALTPEFLAGLGLNEMTPRRSTIRDLRFGVVAIALGIGIASFGWIIDEDDAGRVMMAIGNIPFLIGLSLVALWKFAPRD